MSFEAPNHCGTLQASTSLMPLHQAVGREAQAAAHKNSWLALALPSSSVLSLSHVSAPSNPMHLFQAREYGDSFPCALSTHSQAIKSTLHSVPELGWGKDNVPAGFLCVSAWQDLGRVRGWLSSSVWLNLKTRSCSALGALGYQAAKKTGWLRNQKSPPLTVKHRPLEHPDLHIKRV